MDNKAGEGRNQLGNLPSNLRRIREDKGISSHKLAEMSGVHVNTIFRIENNIGTISLRIFKQIAEVLHCGLDELFYGNGVGIGYSPITPISDETALEPYRYYLLYSDSDEQWFVGEYKEPYTSQPHFDIHGEYVDPASFSKIYAMPETFFG